MNKPRILIVDDSPAIHEDFRKTLVRQNSALDDDIAAMANSLFDDAPAQHFGPEYEIDSAHQGEEGLALVQRSVAEGRPYALIFMDMRMPPGWDGLYTIQKIWEIER